MRHPLFHFFSSFSLFGRFFFDFFYFAGQAAHFLFFIDLFDYTIIFCFYGFNIFLSLPRLLSSFPSFWLTFLFFCKQSHFFSFINIFYFFSPFFIPHRHFTPFSCLSLPLPPVFILFAHVYTTFSPFQSFFAFSQLIFIFFAFFASSIVLHPLFAIFFRSSFIFSFLLMSLSPSHFSRFTSLKMFHVKHRFLRFSVFGDQREAICFLAFRKSLSFFASLIFKIIVFSILFLILSVFSTFSCIFACFT